MIKRVLSYYYLSYYYVCGIYSHVCEARASFGSWILAIALNTLYYTIISTWKFLRYFKPCSECFRCKPLIFGIRVIYAFEPCWIGTYHGTTFVCVGLFHIYRNMWKTKKWAQLSQDHLSCTKYVFHDNMLFTLWYICNHVSVGYNIIGIWILAFLISFKTTLLYKC
jgi:hypothetical protein